MSVKREPPEVTPGDRYACGAQSLVVTDVAWSRRGWVVELSTETGLPVLTSTEDDLRANRALRRVE